MSDFNYDDEPELDENGLPIDEDEPLDDSYDPDENGEDDYEDEDEQEEGESPSGRYGDNDIKNVKNIFNRSSGGEQVAGGDGAPSNWFARLSGGGKGGAGKLAGKTATQASSKATLAGAKSTLAAAAPYIGIALVVILIIVLIVAIISSVMAFIDNKTDPNNMTSNTYITSEYFYGVRSVYIDDNALSNSLQLSYKQYAVDVLTQLDENPSVIINITLPIEKFDNSTQIDQHITNISLAIGNIIANNLTNYNVEFATLYPSIEYFGLTAEQGVAVNTFLGEYFVNNSIISISNGESINALMDTATQNLQYIYNRAEKVMIKDEIATADGLNNIATRQYIASIYMPNKAITITNARYTVVNQNEDFATSIKLIEKNNGVETTHMDETLESDTDVFSADIDNINLTQFGSIDSSDTAKFSAGLSLFDALKTTNGTQYFTKNQETNIYTWTPSDNNVLYLAFSSTSPFIFTEFDLNIK
ncbi:MAG: hypothetical protein IJ358_01635 [Clostridia bacterium]|nr:hypothetical protein [Clostridia bacterium]